MRQRQNDAVLDEEKWLCLISCFDFFCQSFAPPTKVARLFDWTRRLRCRLPLALPENIFQLDSNHKRRMFKMLRAVCQ
ncbi:MAG TPA: hypothetical protein PL157_23270, partial [Acidobacteriota bacterium]|nr:hypothetical protein [Acidobacteriota bacterium]